MKCPLVFSSNVTGMGEQRFVFADCLKEECAWWTPWDSSCAMLTIARWLNLLGDDIEEIKDKMPHAGQFTK
uniref:Uncharacterized protein n=2 Tax=viral metagenome TaxID=1070528 RepID=A0A6H2A4G3_9ZZZZ